MPAGLKGTIMKVTKDITPPKFTPFSVVIHIETEEERQILCRMFGFNVGIPNLVYSTVTYDKRKKLQHMMEQIRDELET